MRLRPAAFFLLALLCCWLAGCGGGSPASSSSGGTSAGPGGTGPGADKTAVGLAVSVKRTPAREIRLATAEDVQEVLIDFLNPSTLQPVVNTTIVRRSAPSVDVVIDVPVGTWIMRIQGRTLAGEVAGSRFETTVVVTEGQTTAVDAELNPITNLTAIQVNPGPTTLLARGTSGQFTATGLFSDLTTQPLTDRVQWTSSNPAVADVSATGLVTAVTPGQAVISARSGNVAGASTLTVTPAPPTALQVTPGTVSLAPGLSRQLTATAVFPDNTNQNVTTEAVWTSSAPGVANVSATGLVTAVASGSATIRATLGNVTATANVTVTPTLRRLELSPVSLVLPVGTTQTVRATGVFSDNTTQDLTTSVTWSTASAAVASVTNTGLVTAVAPGTTNVTASSGNITASASVRVDPVTLVRLAIAPTTATIPKGATRAFNATGTFNNNSTRDLTQEVTWTSTNSSVVAISNANGTRGEATGVNAGTAVVEATLDGISAAASVEVTPATLVSLTLSPANPSVGSGDLVTFRATGTFSDGTSLDLTTNVTWTSSNTSVAVISNAAGSEGQAVSVVNGTATITAASGGVTASTSFTVTAPVPPPPVPSPSVTATGILYATGISGTLRLWNNAISLTGNIAPSLTAATTAGTETLALDRQRNILYVASTASNQVMVFEPASTFGGGTPTRTFGLPPGTGQAVAVDPTRDMIYVAVSDGVPFVATFTGASTLTGTPAVRGQINGFNTIAGLEVDPVNDRLFLTNPGNNRIQIYDSISTLVGPADSDGYPFGSRVIDGFTDPLGLFMDSAGQRLWVAGESYVLVFDSVGPVGFNPTPVQVITPIPEAVSPYVDVARNELYVAAIGATPGVRVYSGASSLNGAPPAPSRWLTGAATGLDLPYSITVDLTR